MPPTPLQQLSQVIGAVNAAMSALYGSSLITAIGPEFLAGEDAPPRIVWVPTTDRFGGSTKGGSVPRPLWSRVAGLDVHLWGQDLDHAEDLLNNLISQIHQQQIYGSYRPTAGRYVDRTGSMLKLGVGYVLSLEFDLPVVALPADTTVQIKAVTLTSQMNFPDGQQPVNP